MQLEQIRLLKPQLESIAKRLHASELRVFGSVVRGEAHAGSDVDFLVHMLPGASLLDIIRLEREFAELLHVEVDVVPDDSMHPLLAPYILKEAMPL